MKINISNDPSVFKGTNERCVTISGSTKNICNSISQILGVLPNKGDGQPDSQYSEQIIIPWSSAGKLIGKVGSNVKRLNDEYHVEVDSFFRPCYADSHFIRYRIAFRPSKSFCADYRQSRECYAIQPLHQRFHGWKQHRELPRRSFHSHVRSHPSLLPSVSARQFEVLHSGQVPLRCHHAFSRLLRLHRLFDARSGFSGSRRRSGRRQATDRVDGSRLGGSS